MSKAILSLGLLAAAVLCAQSAVAQAPMQFKSVNVDLPTGDRMFPGGSAADAINNNCLACHSAGMVLNQPHLSRAEWQAEVEKMINTYKAPVDQKDVAAVVGYLAGLEDTRKAGN
jgi:cytochrome c5